MSVRAAIAGAVAACPPAERLLARAGRRWPGTRVVTSLAHHAGEAIARRGGDLSRVADVDGAKLHVTLDEPLFRLAYFFGTHEPEITGVLRRVARPGQNWLDVGANVGVFTVLLARLVKPGGRVIAYEPNPRLAGLLGRSIRDNGFDHATLRPVAVGAEAGEATLQVPARPDATPGGSGRASLVPQPGLGEVREHRVPVVRLDDDVPHDLPIFGMKMDVEGFEKAALAGMADRLSNRPPAVLLMEFSGLAEALATPDELLATLTGYGYACYDADTRRRIPAGVPYVGGWSDNVIALHGSHHAAAGLRAELKVVE